MSISITEALKTESYAYKCWYNYNYGKNTLGISDSEYSSIISKWSKSIGTWSDFASNDDTRYEISESDLKAARNKGKAEAQEQAGCKGGSGKMIANSVGDAVAGAAVAATTNSTVHAAVGWTTKKVVGQKVSNAAAKQWGEGGGIDKLSDIATVILASAVAAKYWIQKPNKDQVDACVELTNNIIPQAMADLEQTQQDMDDAEAEILDKASEAEKKNEEGNNKIEEEKTELDAERSIYENLMSLKAQGIALRDDQRKWLEEHIKSMQEKSNNINKTAEETSEGVNELYDEIDAEGEKYDVAAENIEETNGIIDYSKSIDSGTRTSCFIEMGAQLFNALGAGVAAAKLIGKLFVGWAFAAIGFAAAASSGIAANQQREWAGKAGQTVNARKETEDLSEVTAELHEDHMNIFDSTQEIIDGLELEIPDDLEVPEGVTAEGSEEGAEVDTGLLQEPEQDENKKEKEEVK